MQKEKYIVVQVVDLTVFVKVVNIKISENYRPIGGASVDHFGNYIQAMECITTKLEEIAPFTLTNIDYMEALLRAWQAGDSGGSVSFEDFFKMEIERLKAYKARHGV